MVATLDDVPPPALLDGGEGRANPSSVVAAVAAAPLGTVEATILGDRLVVGRAFVEADSRQAMGSAWKFTAEYAPFLGRKGVVTDVSPSGAVRVKFDKGTMLWFPAGAIAQFLLPAGGADLSLAIQNAPQAVLAEALQGIVTAYPQLSDFITSKLSANSNGGYSSAAGSACVSPAKSQPSPEARRWDPTPLLDPSKDSGAESPPKSKSGLNPSSPPFRSKQARFAEHGGPFRPASPTQLHPIGKPPATPEESPWEGSVSIVTKVIDDVFH